MVKENKFSNLPDEKSSKPIPEGWELVVEVHNNGSKSLSYVCPASGQTFYGYEMLMRYVNYAKAAKHSIYSPDFVPIQRKKKTNRKSKKQKLLGKTMRQSARPQNLPGKTIPQSARNQGNKTCKLEKSAKDEGPAPKLEESSEKSFDYGELLKKDFRLTYFRRLYKN